MEINFKNIKYKEYENLNLVLENNKINCIVGHDNKYDLLDLLTFKLRAHEGSLLIDNKEIIYMKDVLNLGNSIKLIDLNLSFKKEVVKEEVLNYLKVYKYGLSNVDKRIEDTLSLIGLNEKGNSLIKDLSLGEKYLLKIGLSLAINPNTIIIDDLFNYLDYESKRMLKSLFKRLIKKYNKTIIIFTNDIDYVYDFGDKFYILDNKKLILEGERNIFNDNYDLLTKLNIDIPEIVKFINEVRVRKHIKLYKRTEVKDLIKDIYRSLGW